MDKLVILRKWIDFPCFRKKNWLSLMLSVVSLGILCGSLSTLTVTVYERILS